MGALEELIKDGALDRAFPEIYHTKDVPLPWPEPDIPRPQKLYRHRGWAYTYSGVPMAMGYFRELQFMTEGTLVLKHNDKVWMSTSPMELESHMPHIDAAHGRVLVGGLGMGMYLKNILAKPEVTEVVLYEKSMPVWQLFCTTMNPWAWEGWHKLTIRNWTLFREEPDDEPFDYAYIDIWESLGCEHAVRLTKKACKVHKVRQVSWWGMELDYTEWCMNTNRRADPQDPYARLRAWSKEMKLPQITVGQHQAEWFTRVWDVARNVLRY